MKKFLLAICILCVLLTSCSVEEQRPRPQLCTVSFSQNVKSKSLSVSLLQSCDVTFSFYVRIPADVNNSPEAYASMDKDKWYAVEDLSEVVLSQGEWVFDAVAVDQTIASSLTQETIESSALLKGRSTQYVNLYTTVITIPLDQYGAGNGTVNFTYALADENGSADTLNISSSVLYKMDGTNAGTLTIGNNTIPAGRYLFNAIVKNSSGDVEFSDLITFSVYSGATTKINGRYQEKKPPIDISEETNSDPNSPNITGLKDALDWAGEVKDDTVSVIIKTKVEDKNTIPIATPTDPSVPVFPIPDCVTEVDIDMNGNRFLGSNGGSDLTTLFHLDSGVTLTFNNSQSSQSNVIVGNKGSAITMDGGTLNLNGTSVAPANGNKMPGINLVGCAESLERNRGATINLLQKSYLENCSYGIANIDPATTKPSTINGNVSILVSGTSTINGSTYGISLVDVYGDINIKVEGTGSKISGGIYLKNIHGNVTITVDGASARIYGSIPITIDTMDKNTTLKIVVLNGGTVEQIVNNKNAALKLTSCQATKILEYDNKNNVTVGNTSFSSGWTKRQI